MPCTSSLLGGGSSFGGAGAAVFTMALAATGAGVLMFGATVVVSEDVDGSAGRTFVFGILLLAETSAAAGVAEEGVVAAPAAGSGFAGCAAAFGSAPAGEFGTISLILSFSTSTYP